MAPTNPAGAHTRRPLTDHSVDAPRNSDGEGTHVDVNVDAGVAVAVAVAVDAVEKKKEPRRWRFLDTEETYHFFNDEIVLSTNAIRNLEVEEVEEEDMEDMDAEDDEDEDDEDEDEDHEELMDTETATMVTPPRNRLRGRRAGNMGGEHRDPLRSQQQRERQHLEHGRSLSSPVQTTFDDIFPAVNDLYIPDAVPSSSDGAIDGTQKSEDRYTQQQQHAMHVLSAFCRDWRVGQAYMHRKHSEFLRVCHTRALEGDKDREHEERALAGDDQVRAGDRRQNEWFAMRKPDHLMDTTAPALHPRKWPHLPFRDPREWKDNVAGVLEFVRRLEEIPEGSLLYDPVNVDYFVAQVGDYLKDVGVDISDQDNLSVYQTPPLQPLPALTGFAALLGVAVRLQSFSLLTLVADQLTRRWDSTMTLADCCAPPELVEALNSSCAMLSAAFNGPVPPATYSRALISQWKICSYQPSTSDAIATDGCYLYIYGRSGLLKIGTGHGGTVRDYVYARNTTYTRTRDAERSWICCIGEYLYCRTIVMPSNRVDRIQTCDLKVLDELLFCPSESTREKTGTGGSVYAMVTDGADLYTIKCIDTHKRSIRKKLRNCKVKKIPLKDMARSISSGKALRGGDPNTTEDAHIHVGDRVIRGPDWKWGNQDGEQGGMGTVERISTWGGIKGCGITVRWDKNQRVNTYRWGAESCYDLIVVVEKDHVIVEKKPLPKQPAASKDSVEEELPPRHQFIVHRHDVSKITSAFELDDPSIDLFLDATSPPKEVGKTEGSQRILSSLHSHMLAISSASTSWMCDGGTSDCLGDNSGARYRCTSGCDYDLCDACIHSTMVPSKSELALTDLLKSAHGGSETSGIKREDGPRDGDAPCDGAVISTEHTGEDTHNRGQKSVDVDKGNTSATKGGVQMNEAPDEHPPTKSTPSEDELIKEMEQFQSGKFSKRECQIALRRNALSKVDAASWLESCGEELRRQRILPTALQTVLVAPSKTGIIDPVLLIAGSFYICEGQLCIVSPPGLYHSDQTRRNTHSADAAWFFSLEDGKSCLEKDIPIFLKGVPAGSLMCVDITRHRIVVYSGYLNCVEEYENPSLHHCPQVCKPSNSIVSSSSSVHYIGRFMYNHLHRISGRRYALPMYKHPQAGLQQSLFQVEREASIGVATGKRDNAKSRTRRIKNIRTRLNELRRFAHVDRCGFVVPYCTDFDERGLLSLLSGLTYYTSNIRRKPDCSESLQSLAHVTSILANTARDLHAFDVRLSHSIQALPICKAVAKDLLELARGKPFVWNNAVGCEETRLGMAQVADSSQEALLWGSRVGMLVSVDPGAILCDLVEEVLESSTTLPTRYFSVMMNSQVHSELYSERDCLVAFIKRGLCVLQDPIDQDRSGFITSSSGIQRLMDGIFALSAREFYSHGKPSLNPVQNLPTYTPVEKSLHALFNCCTIGIYDEDPREGEQDGLQLFELFSLRCFATCEKLLRECNLHSTASEKPNLRSSSCGTILPMVLATICNIAGRVSPAQHDALLSVADAVSKVVTVHYDDPSGRAQNRSEMLDRMQVIESSHPYNRNQAALRKVVRVPGASSLHIEFDPRCSTTGEADFVFVTPGHAWFHSDRTPFGESGIGDNGGCFFGAHATGNWPSGGISVWGDTVTIMLCATSQSRGSDESQRWGLKCTVRGVLVQPSMWVAELASSLAHTCSAIVQSTTLDQENVVAPVGCAEAITSCLCEIDLISHSSSEEVVKMVRKIAKDTGGDSPFTVSFEKAMRNYRGRLPGAASNEWKTALRSVCAVLVACSPYAECLFTIEASGGWRDDVEGMSSIVGDCLKIERWMVRRVQTMKEWCFLCEDRLSLNDMVDRFAGNLDKLSDLCNLKGVELKMNDPNSAIIAIHKILESEPVQEGAQMAVSETVALEITKKAEYLLERFEAGNQESLRSEMHEQSATRIKCKTHSVIQFFLASTSMATVRRWERVISKDVRRREQGFDLLEKAFCAVPKALGAKFFVGSIAEGYRLVSNNSAMLADLSSRRAISKRLRIWARSMADVAVNSSMPAPLRLAALVDICTVIQTSGSHEVLASSLAIVVELLADNDAFSATSCGYSLCELAWICFRCVCDRTFGSREFSQENRMNAVTTISDLYDRLQVRGQTDHNTDSSLAAYRLLTTMMPNIHTFCHHRETTERWANRCFAVITSDNPPTLLHVSAIRFLRQLLIPCHDWVYTFLSEQNREGCNLAMVLLERIGYMAFGGLPGSELERTSREEDCCVVVFENNAVHTKLSEAIEKVGEPDLDHPWISASTSNDSTDSSGHTVDSDAEATLIHRNVRCDGCNESPLHGFRFKCVTCPNYDLCTKCYVSQTHAVDHSFSRMTDPNEPGDILPPRSKSGGNVQEAMAVGSKHWKGGVFSVYLAAYGYAVYRRGKAKECITTAQGLAELAFPVTVMTRAEIRRINLMYDWEHLTGSSLQPGAVRLNRRTVALHSTAIRKADRSIIARFNCKISKLGKGSRWPNSAPFVDVRMVASELTSLVRLLLNTRRDGTNTHSDTVKAVAHVLASIPGLVDSDGSSLSNTADYFRALGVANVLGGLREMLRVGGAVVLRDRTSMGLAERGTVMEYAFGNDELSVHMRATDPATSSKTERRLATELVAVSDILVHEDVVRDLKGLVPAFSAIVKAAHAGMVSKEVEVISGALLTDLLVAWLRVLSVLSSQLPALLDNEVISVHGNVPLLLFKLAKDCTSGTSIDTLESKRSVLQHMRHLCSGGYQYVCATRPIPHSIFAADDSNVYRPDATRPSDSTDFVYNMYAYSSRSELPQHSGRNKLLEYWEKNVIPAIESYVAGSFKSYEMDYFFAQLREPLREGNSAAAMKIAFTLCDGHVPSGCQYPDPDTDWSALQIDDVEIGGRYVVAGSTADVRDWPIPMLWTVGHSGVVRVVNPSGMVLLQLLNPSTSCLEEWWYHVDHLKPCAEGDVLSEYSVDSFDVVEANLRVVNRQLIGAIARQCVFELLKMAPEQFSLVRSRHQSENKNYFNLVELLRMAASAELGCEQQAILGETCAVMRSESGAVRSGADVKSSTLVGALQIVLAKLFDRSSYSFEELSDEHSSSGSQAKTSKQPKSGGKSSSASSFKSLSPKQQSQDMDPKMAALKYRYKLMEALLSEQNRCLDASAAFLQENAFMVSSDSPPKPLIMIHVPNASCLVFSFAVHPVLMDLPAGSCLEFFSDERCTRRVAGFFGEKRGLNYLPSLVIPGDRCYVRISQGVYARYKFRVDPLTSDFGLALWIGEEIYQRLLSVPFSVYELESIMTSLLNGIAEYVVGTALPPSARTVVFQLLSKLINFAMSRALFNVVPIVKLSGLIRDLNLAYDNERSSQKALFSLYTQTIVELMSLVEEVSRLKGASPPVFSASWWTDFVRMATFTRVLAASKRENFGSGEFKRIYCGRAPMQEINLACAMLAKRDLLCERMILMQKLPKTDRVPQLESALSRFIIHLAVEECGEADDQSVLSAADVPRFGVLAKVIHLPVDESGRTVGFAVVDVGREDIVSNVIGRLQREKFEFDDGEAADEDSDLVARVHRLDADDASANKSAEGSLDDSHGSADDQSWPCTVCTLENTISDVECAACGSPIPPQFAELASRRSETRNSAGDEGDEINNATSDADASNPAGWACDSCTLLNSWIEAECIACSSKRNPDLVAPTVGNDDIPEKVEDKSPSGLTPYLLSALRVTDLLRVAEDGDVNQINSLFRDLWTVVDHTSEGKDARLSDSVMSLLTREAANHASTPDRRHILDSLEAIVPSAKIVLDDQNGLPYMDRLAAAVLDAVLSYPFQVYRWLRECGYDPYLVLDHYPFPAVAVATQAKWTHQMDMQLLAMAKSVSSGMGILSLMDLCPSHLHVTSLTVTEFPALAMLETRDVRLRFAVLKSLNELIAEALPLVNLQQSCDPNSLRTRIMALRQLVFSDVKIRFFMVTQDNANLACSNLVDATNKRSIVTLDRRRIFNRRIPGAPLSLQNPQDSLFASARLQLAKVKPSVLRAKRPTGASDPFVSFIVVFAGEHVVGEGGPYRQLFSDIANELLSPGNPLFVPTQNNVTKAGEYRERFLPRPSSTSKELIRMFEFVGLLMGCCLRTGVRLNIRLAPIVWKLLVKQSLAVVDLEHIDWSLCESLKYIEAAALDSSTQDDDLLFESFSTTLSDGSTLELKHRGADIAVTKRNCKEYVRLVKAARLQECKPQVDAMLRGIGKIVPVQLLQLCSWIELQQWICGSLEIDVELLKRHTRYSSGMTPDKFPHLDMFWNVLSAFSPENKRRFVNFAWGQDTLPADDAEFDRTHTRLLIKAPPVTTQSQDLLLPKADTCFFNIELPAYSSEAIMREKLSLAITMCTSMDGDDQAGQMELYYTGDELDDDHME